MHFAMHAQLTLCTINSSSGRSWVAPSLHGPGDAAVTLCIDGIVHTVLTYLVILGGSESSSKPYSGITTVFQVTNNVIQGMVSTCLVAAL